MSGMQKVRKAVFPVAGMGTRFLPATKASPKEMLPVVDKPLIQYAVEEAVAAGITELIFVTGRGKRAIEDHFDQAVELELALSRPGRQRMLKEVRGILPTGVSCVFVRQAQALGLGHAILCARAAVGNEPFAVLLADDLIDARVPVMQQMMHLFRSRQDSMVAVERVPRSDVSRYGIVAIPSRSRSPHVITGIVEKPSQFRAPSRLGVVGRYILTSGIFDELSKAGSGTGGEIQLTDAISRLQQRENVLAYEFEGSRFDCGDKLGYLQANVELGKKHPVIGPAFQRYLRNLVR